ncbi:MAG: sugar ABC transporter substrate-binding protein [Anaerolineaceae bacterium]|nr:sugar ABC transporter substrate-binding protein [Anaerolineaceae bacterium]MCY4105833.1 sugar ABC transporter substrate-binding protein [Chloroflexota bacterium]
MRKTTLLGGLLLLMLLSFALISAQDDGPNIALFLPLSNNEYVRNAELGVQNILDANGASLTVFAPPTFNFEEQLNQLQDAITTGGFDAFIFYPADGVGAVVAADMAAEAGIPMIALDAAINEDRHTLVPYENIAAQIARTGDGDGSQIGQAIVMACEGIDPCEVVFQIGFENFPLDLDRFNAVQDVVSKHANIQIVSNQPGAYTQDQGYIVAVDQFQANPGVDVFASVGDQMTLGAEIAAEDAGLDIKLIGQGASQDGYQAVAEGRFFATVANIPYTNGQIAAQMALQVLDGTLLVRSVNMYDQAPPFPASGPIITQDNYEDFEPQW